MDKLLRLNIVVESESAVDALGKLLHRNSEETGLAVTMHKHAASTDNPGHIDAELVLVAETPPTTRQMSLVFGLVAMVDGLVTGILFVDEDIARNMRQREIEEQREGDDEDEDVPVIPRIGPNLVVVKDNDQ